MAWWNREQLCTFLDLTASEALGPLFRVAAMTGMRRGEVCGLAWADVDLGKGRIQVCQQITTLKGELLFSERTKTDRGRWVHPSGPGHRGGAQDAEQAPKEAPGPPWPRQVE
jgi:integrase